MDAVEETEAERVGKEAFDALDMANYTKYTFSMFGGEVQNVELVFQNRMMGAAMDRFGRDIVPMRVDDNHFRIVVPVAVSQQFFAWVFGLGKAVRIAGPESVKGQMKTALADIAARYEEQALLEAQCRKYINPYNYFCAVAPVILVLEDRLWRAS